jgi:AcrR family transcriptional regulator
MPRRAKEDAERTRAQILASALSLFVSKGYENTTFTDIAARLKMTKGAVYWHFASKVELLSTLIGEAIDRFCNERTARMKDCETTFPAMAEMLVEMAERIVADKKRSEFFMLMQTGLKWTDAPLAGLARKIFEERVNGPYHAVMDALAADKLAGRVRSDIDAHEISASVMALFDGLIRRKIEGFLFSDMAKTMKSSYSAIYQSIKI